MEITIDKGVPIPAGRGRYHEWEPIYVLAPTMEIGDSFALVIAKKKAEYLRQRLQIRTGFKYITRTVVSTGYNDVESFRFWRTA